MEQEFIVKISAISVCLLVSNAIIFSLSFMRLLHGKKYVR